MNSIADYERSIAVMAELGALTPELKAEVDARIEKMKRVEALAQGLGFFIAENIRSGPVSAGYQVMTYLLDRGWTAPEGLL